MVEERKVERIPDLSYDLDRDGKVGGQDMVLSRKFDADKNGRLEPEERKAAERALEEGIIEKFRWGADNALRHRSQRLMSVRGVTIDGDDYSGLLGTYPKYPVQDLGERPKTYSELKRVRSEEKVEHMRKMKADWDRLHPMTIQVNSHLPPKSAPYALLSFPTRAQKLEMEQAAKREGVGLGPAIGEINKTERPPTCQYTEKPEYRTKSEMDEAKRKTMVPSTQLKELHEKKNYAHVGREQHMLTREGQHIWIVPEGQENVTMRQVAARRRKATNEYNLKMFSSTAIGIHGKELPKFAEYEPEYWRLRPGFTTAPSLTSHLEVEQRKKYWAPIDTYKLMDKDVEPPPPDSLKAVHILPEKPKQPVALKPTELAAEGFNPMEHRDPPQGSRRHNYRWTTLVHYFQKGSIFAPPKDPDLLKPEEEVKNQDATSSNEVQSANIQSQASNLHIRKVATNTGRLLKSNSQSLIRTRGFPEA